jgi:hypothetical protein
LLAKAALSISGRWFQSATAAINMVKRDERKARSGRFLTEMLQRKPRLVVRTEHMGGGDP